MKESYSRIMRFVMYTVFYLLAFWLFFPLGYIQSKRGNYVEDPSYRPKVAVVIPYRNKEDTIYEVLESIINQSYSPSKVIVTDDYSTDGSLGEIMRFANYYFNGVSCERVSDKMRKYAMRIRGRRAWTLS